MCTCQGLAKGMSCPPLEWTANGLKVRGSETARVSSRKGETRVTCRWWLVGGPWEIALLHDRGNLSVDQHFARLLEGAIAVGGDYSIQVDAAHEIARIENELVPALR